MIIDELYESFSGIRDEFLELILSTLYPLAGFLVFSSLLESAEGDPVSLAGGVLG